MARDLNGRRLRDIENEQRLTEYVETAHEREREADEERLNRLEKIATLDSEENKRKHKIDADFDEVSKEVTENVEKAMEMSSGNRKRKPLLKEEIAKKQKIKKFGFDEDDLSDLSSSEDEAQTNSIDHVSSGSEETSKPKAENYLHMTKSTYVVVQRKFEENDPKKPVLTKLASKKNKGNFITIENEISESKPEEKSPKKMITLETKKTNEKSEAIGAPKIHNPNSYIQQWAKKTVVKM